ncbi:MAG: hypothetical protein M3Q62_09630 [Actinomycetota bacterium]|nr:hypothetical protein [Rubrobacteraceae bacterium]MBA3702862.1 hypothetical protein [Rubrobacteraceae bacterium]MDQ3183779.1 hypothetical protein [Actinomycetota bacterium]MDQ3495991.1 hypothetical protein [Actinomycetota bacterium]
MAGLTITVDEENMKRARALGSGAGALPTKGMPHGLLVEGMGVENPFL